MNPEEKQAIQAEIQQRIIRTKQKIENLREKIKPIPLDGTIGRVTRMDAIGHKSISEANLRDAQESLFLLEEALESLNTEGFGQCVKCKNKIPLERIITIPEVRLCVSCAAA